MPARRLNDRAGSCFISQDYVKRQGMLSVRVSIQNSQRPTYCAARGGDAHYLPAKENQTRSLLYQGAVQTHCEQGKVAFMCGGLCDLGESNILYVCWHTECNVSMVYHFQPKGAARFDDSGLIQNQTCRRKKIHDE